MPVVYRCSRCGQILHVFIRVGQNSYGVPTPSELASRYGGVCPRCGKPLNTRPDPDHDIELELHGLDRLEEELRKALLNNDMYVRYLVKTYSYMLQNGEELLELVEDKKHTISPQPRAQRALAHA